MQAKTIKKIILGNNPTASVAGYLLAGNVAVQPFLADEFVSTKRLIAIGITSVFVAILGRIASNSKATIYRRRKKEEDVEGDNPEDHPNDI